MSSRRRSKPAAAKRPPAPLLLTDPARLDDPEWQEQYVDHRWLNLGDVSSLHVDNQFVERADELLADPAAFLLEMMSRPENFGYACEVLFGKTLAPFQMAILHELWIRPFPMLIGARGMGKSWILAVYCMLRALFEQGSKIVIVGAAFRQSKVIFDYCQELWENGPVYRDIAGADRDKRSGPRRDVDRCSLRVGDSIIVALPLGDGSKIRGQRANIIIADEFACLDKNTLVETDLGLVRIGDHEGLSRADYALLQPNGGEPIVPNMFIETSPTEAYRVVTEGGYEFTCSSIHQVMTTEGWKRGVDLTPDDYLVHEASDRFPDRMVTVDGLTVDEEVGWLLGTLVAEGCVSGKYQVSVHATDLETVKRVGDILRKLSPNSVGLSTHAAHIDPRGWDCKESYTTWCCDLDLRNRLESLGLSRSTAHTKKVPWSILRSPRSVVLSFLSGLFDGDGSAFLWSSRGRDTHLGVAYYTVSEQLASEVQVVLHKLGLFCYRTKRRSKLSDIPQWMLRLNGEPAHQLAALLDVPRWRDTVVSAHAPRVTTGITRVKDGRWKAQIRLHGKNKYLGTFVEKADAEAAYRSAIPAPSLRVRLVERLPDERVLYDYSVPGSHRFLANGFVQHNSISEDIFERVVRGFAAVSLSPVKKYQEEMKKLALEELGFKVPEKADGGGLNSNQTVISGTAYYSFNHFYKYWKRYKAIIESGGDRRRLAEVFGSEKDIPKGVNHRDYSVIRIPVHSLPPGFMDEKQIAQAKATVHSGTYLMEYSGCFSSDSAGFFKRTLIESCVVGRPQSPVVLPSSGPTPVRFTAALKGLPTHQYVLSVDPASERDNLSVTALELWPDHRRIRYCWTTTRRRFKEKLSRGLVEEQDFYRYCARQIRRQLAAFPAAALAIDSQGGGVAIMEALQDESTLEEGELPILPVIDPENPKPTDGRPGLHIIHVINFADANWVSQANHGMRKDFEDKSLLFPEFDPAVVALSHEEDKASGRVQLNQNDLVLEGLYDTLEDCVLEIEELKEELASIVHTQTGTAMRDRWDTPEVKVEGGKKGRLRKDRYSALLMANMVGRTLQRTPKEREYKAMGGFAHALSGMKVSQDGMWISTGGEGEGAWWSQQVNRQFSAGGYGAVVKRR